MAHLREGEGATFWDGEREWTGTETLTIPYMIGVISGRGMRCLGHYFWSGLFGPLFLETGHIACPPPQMHLQRRARLKMTASEN